MSAELILAAIGGAELAIRCGKELLEAYRAFKGANDRIRDKILTVEAMWNRTAMQVDFLRRVARSLPEEHCCIQVQVLQMLIDQFRASRNKIDSVIRKTSKKPPNPESDAETDEVEEIKVRGLKYVIVRESIDDTIANLERWQRIFDPTWYLMLRVGDRLIDAELASGLLIDAPEPKPALSPSPSPSPSPSASSLTLLPPTPSSSRASSTTTAVTHLRGTIRPNNGTRSSTGGGSAQPVLHVSLPQEGLDWLSASEIPYSTTRTIARVSGGSSHLFAVDSVSCGSTNLDVHRARADAEALARKLSQVDSDAKLGVLPCRGLVKRRHPVTKRLVSLDLVFRLPSPSMPQGTQALQLQTGAQMQPVSLREHLLREGRFSLTRRLNVARQLAEAVSFVHTCDFVHKNVRPEAVLVFPETMTEPSPLETDDEEKGLLVATKTTPMTTGLGAAYLLGFDSFRSVSFHTLRTGDNAWERNLYRHPLRQGLRAQEDYIMQHDVYGLGVCLLELGLWKSFVVYDEEGGKDDDDGEEGDMDLDVEKVREEETDGGDAYADEPRRRAYPSSALGGLTLADFGFGVSGGGASGKGDTALASLERSQEIKDHLVRLAKSELPARMGDTYTAVVITCLTCLDKDNEDFGDEEDMCDEDGILIGVRFIEKVLFKLNSISV